MLLLCSSYSQWDLHRLWYGLTTDSQRRHDKGSEDVAFYKEQAEFYKEQAEFYKQQAEFYKNKS